MGLNAFVGALQEEKRRITQPIKLKTDSALADVNARNGGFE